MLGLGFELMLPCVILLLHGKHLSLVMAMSSAMRRRMQDTDGCIRTKLEPYSRLIS
jgi:hypothetical protein